MKQRMMCGFLLILLSTNGWSDDTAKDKPESAEAKTPKIHTVKRGRLKIDIDLSGTFESGKMSPVSIRPKSWSTLVVKRAVAHGQNIKRGEPLVWLETDKLDEAIKSAEHAVKTATLALQQAEADLQLAQDTMPLDLKAAELAKKIADESLLDFIKVDRSRSIASAKRSLDSSRFMLEYAQEELNQLKKMYEADDLTEETEEIILKRAERSVDSSKYALESAEIRTARRLERDIPRTQQELTDAATRQEYALRRTRLTSPASLETKRLGLEKMRVDLTVARRKLDMLKQDRELMVIKSPADGIVYFGRCVRGKWLDKSKADSMLKPGGTVLAKQTLVTVVARQPLKVRVDLKEEKLSTVKKGLSGMATPKGFPQRKLPVKVEHVSYIPIGSGVFDCLLSITDNSKIGPVVPGMSCTVKIVQVDKKNVLTVPPAAIHKDADGKAFVYLAGAKPTKRSVTVGQRGGKVVEVTKGLKENDKILLGKP